MSAKHTHNGNGALSPEQWVDLSRKFARQARGEFARKDLSVINNFIRFVGAKPKILGINRHRSKQDHPTPWNLISAIENRFDNIEIDLAATKSNTKAGRYITSRENSLKQDWTEMLAGKLGYLNPPFDPVTPWIDKCIEEAVKGARFVMLTQASIDSKWFWKMFPYCTVYALRSRVTFVGSSHSFPKPLILSAFNVVRIGAEPGPSGRLHEWDWMRDAGAGGYMETE